MKQSRILLFLIILFANIAGNLLNSQLVDYISKPLIVIFLVVWFLFETKMARSGLKKWILFALFFSLAGDVLLLFQQNDKLFFLLGLSAFLLAHIFYIIFFHFVRVKERVRSNAWFLLIVVVYYAVLITFLSPYLGDMKLPVRIYGIVISFMLMLAMHMPFTRNKIAGQWMLAGALLFVISDSVLAINKFYESFEMAPVIIMLTYGLAQLFIVAGAARYITSTSKE
ncbi:MAG: lysoplasmalogenase [Bacteroidota bacterium]|nr:lysoplasmalogenase [Bacteroidota bacterium]